MTNGSDTTVTLEHITPTIAAAQRGSARAFGDLVRQHKDRVFRMVARFALNEAEIDELAQDVFIDLHRSLSRFRGEAPLEHWIARIATRRCRDHLRRRYRQRLFRSLDSMRETGFDPHQDVTGNPRVEALFDAMRRLKPDDQTILILFSLEGFSIKEIAEHCGWTDANVKVRLFRARRKLRKLMEDGTT